MVGRGRFVTTAATEAFLMTFALFSLGPVARAETIADPVHHYTLQLPDNWQRLDQQFLAVANEQIRARSTGNINYDTGFQKKNSPPGEYPYILVHWQSGALPDTYEMLEREFPKGAAHREKINDTAKKIADVASALRVGEWAVDRDRNRVVFRVQMDVVGVGKIQGLNYGYLSKDGVLSFSFYDRDTSFAASVLEVEGILSTFKYDEDYAFKPSDSPVAKLSGPAVIIPLVVAALIIFGTIAVIVIITVALTKNKPKRKAKLADYED